MKKLVAALLSAILCINLSFVVFAHSGRTDSNGGHWDHSTGTYHYHTGEYAGREQSGSDSSDSIDWKKAYESVREERKRTERKNFVQLGREEGSKQLYLDNLYEFYYDKGFLNAKNKYLKNHPFFSLMIQNDNRDILYYDFYHFKKNYEDRRAESFDKHYSSDYSSSESNLRSSFNSGYNLSYNSSDGMSSVSSSFKKSNEAEEIRNKGYEDGYNQFYNGNLYAYRETYPIEAFFTLISITQIILSLIIILLIILTIVYKKRKRK